MELLFRKGLLDRLFYCKRTFKVRPTLSIVEKEKKKRQICCSKQQICLLQICCCLKTISAACTGWPRASVASSCESVSEEDLENDLCTLP